MAQQATSRAQKDYSRTVHILLSAVWASHEVTLLLSSWNTFCLLVKRSINNRFRCHSNHTKWIPPDGATARGGPWPPLQYASRPFGSLLCLSISLHPSFSGPWTRHPAISFLVFLFVSLRTAFCTTSFLGFWFLAFFLYGQAIVFFGI